MSDPYGPPQPDDHPQASGAPPGGSEQAGHSWQQPGGPSPYGPPPSASSPYGLPPQQPSAPHGQQHGQQHGQPWQQPQPYATGAPVPADERTWAAAAHWSALVAAFVALAFLGPLLVMLTKGTQSPYVRRQAVESLNFQLSMLVYGVLGTIVGVVLVLATLGIGAVLVLPLALAFAAWWLVFTIIGSVRASNGEEYRYPLTMRMVS